MLTCTELLGKKRHALGPHANTEGQLICSRLTKPNLRLHESMEHICKCGIHGRTQYIEITEKQELGGPSTVIMWVGRFRDSQVRVDAVPPCWLQDFLSG